MLGDFKIAKCIYTDWYLAEEDLHINALGKYTGL